MIALTIDRNGLLVVSASKYRSRVFVHKSAPPHEANTSASAKFPFRKQHSTAASKLPTNRDFFTIVSAAFDIVVGLDFAVSSIDTEEMPLDKPSLYSAAAFAIAV